MKTRLVWIALAVSAAVGGGAFYYTQSSGAEARAADPGANPRAENGPGPRGREGRRGERGGNRPIPVAVAESRTGDIHVDLNAIGTVTALNTVTVRPRVDGLLERIQFREGQHVRAGDVVAEIDPRPYATVLEQASGQLKRDQAQFTNARLDLERYRNLLAKDSIARQEVDAQEALVRQLEGTVQTDQAQVDAARLNFNFTRITAPVGGTLGLRQVDAGNMVRASDATGLVIITQTQPISVVFSVPAQYLPALQAPGSQGLSIEAWDRDGRQRIATGKLVSTDNLIDTSTGTVKLKAQFENRDNRLFPNQFVSARLRVDGRQGAVLVPSAAILKGAEGSFVYVVNEQERTVRMRPVVLGPSTADTVAIESGLKAGEKVVTEGVDRLRDGAPVELPGSAGGPEGGRRGPGGGEGKGAPRDAQKPV